MQTKVVVVLFGQFADVESDRILERSKKRLTTARVKGLLLRHPKDCCQKSKLGDKEGEVLKEKTSKASMTKIVSFRQQLFGASSEHEKSNRTLKRRIAAVTFLRGYFNSYSEGTPERSSEARFYDGSNNERRRL
jgi:hypothetical protein